jgi:hypothetical protein
MIPVFERVKTVHALDRAATVIGDLSYVLRLSKIANIIRINYEMALIRKVLAYFEVIPTLA